MIRQTYEEINLKALESNVKSIISQSSEYKYHIGVVKANCYGLGLKCIKSIIKGGANYLAVSSLEEALSIRKITKEKILILEPINPKYISLAKENNITLTISSLEYLNNVKDQEFTCHIKINTGMNRLGINSKEEFDEVYNIIMNSNITLEGIYTHIYKASDSKCTNNQFKKFEYITSDIDLNTIPIVHIPNSETIFNYKKKPYINGCRMGIIMYGFSNNIKLNSVFSLISKVIEIKHIHSGDTVGYDGKYIASGDESIAVLPIGYADGILRHNSGRNVYINGKEYKIVGNICMDMLFVKVDDSVKVNDEAYIIKDNDHINQIASYLDTINYEVMCSISDRVVREYKK
mgnify:FL=1